MRELKIAFLIAVVAVAVAVMISSAFSAPGPDQPLLLPMEHNQHSIVTQAEDMQFVPGLWWDESMWSAVPVPDSLMVCRKYQGQLHCLLVPTGSILFIPTPGDTL